MRNKVEEMKEFNSSPVTISNTIPWTAMFLKIAAQRDKENGPESAILQFETYADQNKPQNVKAKSRTTSVSLDWKVKTGIYIAKSYIRYKISGRSLDNIEIPPVYTRKPPGTVTRLIPNRYSKFSVVV